MHVVEFGVPPTERCGVIEKLRGLYADGILTDFVIRVGDREFKTHRCVLASGEGFFRALVMGAGSGMREAETQSVELDDVDPDLLALVLDYCYGSPRIEVEFARVMDLLGVAVRFQVRGLAAQCAQTLRRALNERNCCELFAAADAHGCAELRDAARDAVVSWLPTLLRQPAAKKAPALTESRPTPTTRAEGAKRRAARRAAERDATFSAAAEEALGADDETTIKSRFATLPAALALEILASDRLGCDESVVFAAAVAWVEARQANKEQPKKRRRAAGGSRDADDDAATCEAIVGRVRYPLMDATFLSDVVKTHPAMQTPHRQALIAEAFEHMALRAAGRDRGAVADEKDVVDDDDDVERLYELRHRARPRKQVARARAWPPRLGHVARTFDDENGHTDAVAALCVCAGRVVSGSWDSMVKVWHPETGKCENTLEDPGGTVRGLADVAGRLVSASEDGTIRVWDPARSWSHVRTLHDHSDIVNAIVPLVDLPPTRDDDEEHDAAVDAPPDAIEAQTRLAARVASNRATKFASGGDDGAINIWSADDLRCLLTLHSQASVGVLVLAATPGTLISGSDDAKIHIWSTTTWTLERTLADHSYEIWALVLVGDYLVSASVDHTIKVWTTRDWRCERTLRSDGPVYALANLQNHLVSGSSNGTITAWNHDWEEEPDRGINCSGVWCVTVHNDRLISGGVNGVIKIWDH